MRGIEILRQPAVGAALPQLFEQDERIGIVQMQLAADHVHFAAGDKDAVVGVLDLARQPLQFLGRRLR